MKYFCKLCEHTMELPADAVPVSQPRGRGYRLWRFDNGELHDLREVEETVVPNDSVGEAA